MLVNNAGITRDNLLFKMSEDDWDLVMNVHLKGAFLMSREAQKHMVPAKYGKILNLSSVSALGNRGQANYSAAKMGVQGFTRSLALELGPFGINVNAIAPGFIVTEMTDATAVRLKMEPEELRRLNAEANPGPPGRRARGHRRRCGVPLQRRGVVHHRSDAVRRRRREGLRWCALDLRVTRGHGSARRRTGVRTPSFCGSDHAPGVQEPGFVHRTIFSEKDSVSGPDRGSKCRWALASSSHGAATNPDPEGGSVPGSVEGRWRDFSPVQGRTQRMHRFTGNLLAAVGDATAGGVEGVALGCLSAVEAGEAVLELHEVMARLKGLQLALLAHADQLDVHAQADGPAPVNTAAWLAHRGLVAGRAARGQVRQCRASPVTSRLTGSALLAGDIDAAQAEVVVAAVRRLPETLDVADRARAEKVMLTEARRLDAAELRVVGDRLLEVIDPDAAEALEAKRLQDEEDAADAKTWLTTWDDRDGTTHLNVKLSTRHADMLRTALHAIANPSLADAITRTTTTHRTGTGTSTGTGTARTGRAPRPPGRTSG